MRRAFFLFLSVAMVCGIPATLAASAELEIIRQAISVEIGGKNYKLDALVGKPAGAGPGAKLPVALITHGAAGRDPPRRLTLASLSGWVRNFSARGYLAIAVMRRGYGGSDGPISHTENTCQNPNPARYLQQQADDLAAALRAIILRDDVDPATVVVIGHSAGAAAMLALTARPDMRISAAINVAGGTFRYQPGMSLPADVYRGCERFAEAMDKAMAAFARDSDTPTLWLYAENDPFFPPELAEHWIDIWRDNQGDGQLEILPAHGAGGHKIFIEPEGQEILWPRIDGFLRGRGLPDWKDGRFDELRGALGPSQRKRLNAFLAGGLAFKAFAVPIEGGTKSYGITKAYSLDGARAEVIGLCRQESGQECVVIVENFEPTGLAPTPPSRTGNDG